MSRRSRLVVLLLLIAGLAATARPVPARSAATHRLLLPLIHNGPPASIAIVALKHTGDDEYLALGNRGPAPVDLTGWRIQSADGTEAGCPWLAAQAFTFPAGYTLAAGGTVRVHSGPGAVNSPPGDLRWTGFRMWNDGGDRGQVLNAAGRLVDRHRYGDCD